MNRYRLLIAILALMLGIMLPGVTAAQNYARMVNGATINIAACEGTVDGLVDDGGPTAVYSNNFNGYAVLTWSAGTQLTLQGNYNLESNYDYLTLDDGTGTTQLTGSGVCNYTSTTGILTITFHTDVSVTYDGFLLTWSVAGGTCVNSVTNLSATNIGPTSATLHWTATNAAGPFTIVCDGDTTTATTTNCILTGLNASSQHTAVVAGADETSICCRATISFRTTCDTVHMPWNESFEGMEIDTMAECWTAQTNFDDENAQPHVVNNYSIDGDLSLMTSCGNNSTGGHFGLVFGPRLDLGTTGYVRFGVRASHSNTCLVIGTCNMDSSYTTRYDFIATDTVYVGTSWQRLMMPARSIAAGRSLAFYMLQSMQGGYGRRVYIDGVGIDACGIETASVYNIESNRMTVEWTTYGTTSVTLHVRRSGSTVDEQTLPAATSPTVLTGLEAATTYYVVLSTECGTSTSVGGTTADSATTISRWCLGPYGDNDQLENITLKGATASKSSDYIYFDHYGTGPFYVISPEFNGLAGKQIAVCLDGYYSHVSIGLMRSRNDTSTFIPLDGCYTEYFKTQYLFADIPDTNTATFVALRFDNHYLYVRHLEVGNCLIDSLRVVHRRGTSVVIGLESTGPNDTVLVEYGINGFTQGSGTVRTFVGQRRIIVDSLNTSYGYDFIVSRPCGGPACSNARLRAYTAYVDYPLPLCEDFSNLYWSNWYGYGYWSQENTYDNTPRVTEHPYYFGAGQSLQLSSFGFSNSYYSSVTLPDVPIDSGCYLSFYATNMAPDGELLLGNYMLTVAYGDRNMRYFDTLQLAGYGVRQHFVVPLPADDTLFDGRLHMRYQHSNQYQNFSVFIDEVQITHATYLNASVTMVDSNNADVVVHPYTAVDTLFEVTLRDEANAFVGIDTIGASDTAHFHGLAHCEEYKVYVRPLLDADSAVCPSYATYFVTSCGGSDPSVHNCFPFNSELSYELPYGWTATDDASHSVDTGYLHLYGANAKICMPNYGDVEGRTLSMLAVGHGTLVIGYADTNFATFTPFDTISLAAGDTVIYARQLPARAADSLRIALRVATAGDTVRLDRIGVSLCLHIDINIEGNTAEVTTDATDPLYYLFVVDTTGAERMFMINTPSYTVTDLMPGWLYDFSWQCAYDDANCRPHVLLRTDNQLKVPYCIDFGNGTSTEIANAWDFYSPSVNAYRYDYSDRIRYYSQYSTSYLVLPPLDSTTAVASLGGYMYRSSTASDNNFAIGVLTDGSDTSTFVSLWTPTSTSSYMYPEVDLSGYAGKRIAIRNNSYSFTIYRLFLHPYSAMTVHRTEAGRLELHSAHGDYYLRAYNDWYGFDTIIHVDSTYYILDFSDRTYYEHIYLQQTNDSLGNVCRNELQSYYLSNRYDLPWCWSNSTAYNNFINYNYYSTSYYNGKYATMFYGRRSSAHNQIVVLPEFTIDSVSKLNIKFSFASEETDTQMVILGVMTDAFDTTTFVPVDTVYYQADDGSWADYQVNLGNYTGNGRWPAIRYNPEYCSYSCNRYSYISDFCVDSCAATGANAKLVRWNTVEINNASGEGGFYAVYHPQYTSDYTIVRIDSVPTTLTLPGSTRYEFYFRCDSSTNYTCRPTQEIITLGTPMEVPSCTDFEDVNTELPPSWRRYYSYNYVQSSISNSGNKALSISTGSDQSFVVTGDIETDTLNKIAVSLWMYNENPNDRLEVGTMSNPADLATFHSVRTLTNRQIGTWQRHTIILSNAPSDAHYIALRGHNIANVYSHIYIDDIFLTPCAASDMRLSSVDPTEYSIEWQQTGTPNITVTVEENGVPTMTLNPTVSPLNITGIDPHNAYTIRFTSDCSDSGTYCTTHYVDSATIVAVGEGGGCINPTNLYSPQATFFTGTYSNPYSTSGVVDYGVQSADSRHTVCYDTAARDPRTGGLLRMVPEGFTSSLRLGNWGTNSYAPEAEGVIYSLAVDTSDFELILLRYAAVLQDPLHAPEDQPRFRIEVLDSTFTPIDPSCTSADFIADASLGWNSAPNSVLWKDWTAVGIDLSSYSGQLVYIRLTTFDCNEGSHYGYAYFTLECMRKAMESTACGNIDSNTFTAPSGFNYRWYSSQSNATISTEQSITMATADITYYCDLSKIDNSSCMFTISTYGGTRYPMASFDTTMTMSNCRFYVSFTNTSSVSADGITPLPGEGCESAYWDFGNGQTSTAYHASTVYTMPGTYTVMLVSGIAGDACTDTFYFNLTLTIPDGVIPMDSTYATICSNESYTFYGSSYNLGGMYSHTTENVGRCDSLHLLFLTVHPTSASDTVATACDTFYWRGTTYTNTNFAPQDFTQTLLAGTPNRYGCDSTVTLNLTLYAQHTESLTDAVTENSLPYFVGGTSVSLADLTPVDSQYSVYSQTYNLTTTEGCDSTLNFDLTVWLNSSSSHTHYTCRDMLPFAFNGDLVQSDSSEAYRTYHTLTTNGADSTIYLHLYITDNPTATFYDTVIENALPYVFRGFSFNGPTDTTLMLISATTCDTLADYHLHVWPNQSIQLVRHICDNELPFRWNGVIFNGSDTASVVMTDMHGADSNIFMTLRVWPTYDVRDTHVICPSDGYYYEGVDYGGPIEFDAPHLSAYGCDSLVHVVLLARDTSFHLKPIYSLDGATWLSADTILQGCAPDTIYLRDTTPEAASWQWLVTVGADTMTSTTDQITVAYPNANALASTTNYYQLVVLSTGGCSDTLSRPIYIFSTPNADFDWTPQVPAIDNPEVQFSNLSSPSDSLTYMWYIPKMAGSTDYDTTSDVAPFYHWGQDGDNMEGDYDVRLIAYWAQTAVDTSIHHMCTDTAMHTVTITNDFLQFPNLVTPDGDGNNDIWRVVNLVEYGNYPQNELWIFNQWGAEVYHVRDISKEEDFWDPNATGSPDGTYYYRFSARGPYGIVKRNGIIEVLRK